MRRTTGILVLAGLLIAAGVVLAAAIDVTGDWEMTSQSPMGEMTMPVHFVQKGEAVEVTMKMPGPPDDQGGQGQEGPGPREMKGTGTIKGNAIEWTFTMKSPDGDERSMTHKGTIIDADNMKGTLSMGEMGDIEWTAKRVKK